jgi:nicotinate-nucleotide adenylyltransferase
VGADQYAKLDRWHRPEEVKRLARIGVFGRPGVALDEKVNLIPMQPMPLSASEIRARAKRGEDLEDLVPPAVANYIAGHRLYR